MAGRIGVALLAAALLTAGASAATRGVVAGGWAGATAQGKKVTFRVTADGTALQTLRTTVLGRCGRTRRSRTVSLAAPLKVGADGRFAPAGAAGAVAFRGRLSASGVGSGGLRVRWKAAGATCDSGLVGWSARALAPAPAATPPPADVPPPATVPAPAAVPPPAAPQPPLTGTGKYCGFTAQDEKSMCLDVDAGGRTVTSIRIEVRSQCGTSDWYVITSQAPDPIPIADDRSFSYTWSSGELAGSAVDGSFDGSGMSSGTIHVHASFDQDGRHFDCESTTVNWSARLGA